MIMLQLIGRVKLCVTKKGNRLLSRCKIEINFIVPNVSWLILLSPPSPLYSLWPMETILIDQYYSIYVIIYAKIHSVSSSIKFSGF